MNLATTLRKSKGRFLQLESRESLQFSRRVPLKTQACTIHFKMLRMIHAITL